MAQQATIEVIGDGYLLWGKLVKTWATGESYFDRPYYDGPNPIPVGRLLLPRSLQELKDQLKAIGAEELVKVPSEMTGLTIIQHAANTLVVKLPPKELIRKKESALAAGGSYPLPDFYADILAGELTGLDAHAARTGDYTIQMCG